MTKLLDHGVLKRTHGLLSEIDEVLRKSTIADRVDRVLQSAAPSLGYNTYRSIEAWEWAEHESTGDGSFSEELDRFWDDIEENNCGCERRTFWVTTSYPDARHEPLAYDRSFSECEIDHLGRPLHDGLVDDPFQDGHDVPRVSLGHQGAKAADEPCGAEGCVCETLFEPAQMCIHCDERVRLDDDGKFATVRTRGTFCHTRWQDDSLREGLAYGSKEWMAVYKSCCHEVAP